MRLQISNPIESFFVWCVELMRLLATISGMTYKEINVYVNGGYFVISKSMINKIRDKNIYWENEPLNYAIKYKKLFAFKHKGFWKSLDTLKDKNDFNEMFKKKNIPWIN